MALIKCPECSAEISDRASTCVKCGCPVKDSDSQATAMEAEVSTHSYLDAHGNKHFLLKCPKCGAEVSNGANSCLKCGCLLKKSTIQTTIPVTGPIVSAYDLKPSFWVKYKVYIILLILIAIVLIFSGFCGGFIEGFNDSFNNATQQKSGSRPRQLNGNNPQEVLTAFERSFSASESNFSIPSSDRYQYSFVVDASGRRVGLQATILSDKGRFVEGSYIQTSHIGGRFQRCAGNDMFDGGAAFADGVMGGFVDGISEGRGILSSIAGGAVRGIAGGVKDEMKISSTKRAADALFKNFLNQRDVQGNVLWCADMDKSTTSGGSSSSSNPATINRIITAANIRDYSSIQTGYADVEYGARLNLRPCPQMNDDCTPIAKVERGAQLIILGESRDGKWKKIRHNNIITFASSQFISSVPVISTCIDEILAMEGYYDPKEHGPCD